MIGPKVVRFSGPEPFLELEPSYHSRKGRYWRVYACFAGLSFLALLLVAIILTLKHGAADTSTHNSEDPFSSSTSTTTLLPPVHVAAAVDTSYNALTSASFLTTMAPTTEAPVAAPASTIRVNTNAALSTDEKGRSRSGGPCSTYASNTPLLKFAVSITTTLLCGSYALPFLALGALNGILADPLPGALGLSDTTYPDDITQSIDTSVGANCMPDITMTLTSTTTVIVATKHSAHSTPSMNSRMTAAHVATKAQVIVPTVVGGDLSSMKSRALATITDLGIPSKVSSLESEILATASAVVSSLESKLLPPTASSTSAVLASPATMRSPQLSVFALAVAVVFVSNPFALPFLVLCAMVKVNGEPVKLRRDVIEVISSGENKAVGRELLGLSLSAEKNTPGIETTSTSSISPNAVTPTSHDIAPVPTTILVQQKSTISVLDHPTSIIPTPSNSTPASISDAVDTSTIHRRRETVERHLGMGAPLLSIAVFLAIITILLLDAPIGWCETFRVWVYKRFEVSSPDTPIGWRQKSRDWVCKHFTSFLYKSSEWVRNWCRRWRYHRY